jgi:NitT/TauT family transport system substrate-binding protein
MKVFNAQLKVLTGKTVPQDELKAGLSRLRLTYDPIKDSLYESANNAFDIGFLGQQKPNLTNPDIYDLTLLNQVLTENGLPLIR